MMDRLRSLPGLGVYQGPHCEHERCSRICAREWCCHWFVLEWAVSHFTVTEVVVERLRSCLEQRLFRFWGSCAQQEDGYVYRFLLYLEPEGLGLPEHQLERLTLPAEHSGAADLGLNRDACLLTAFPCCLDFLARHASHLASTIVDEGASILFGEENLRFHLDREISSYLVLAPCIPVPCNGQSETVDEHKDVNAREGTPLGPRDGY